jgi:hypothetical protein
MPSYYGRIVNPYMPQGSASKTNAPSPYYAPGELGGIFNDPDGKTYLRVQLDSGATTGVGPGIVAVGQLAFWKDQSKFIVTNDKNQCDLGASGAVNRVAGIFGVAVTAAPGVNGTDGQPKMYMCDLIVKAQAYPIQATGTIVAGAVALADTTASVSRAVSAATVTTAPVSQVLGVFTTTVITNNLSPCDVNIGFLD